MKKLIALLLAVVMVFGLVACGGNTTPETTKPAETTPTAGNETTEAPELTVEVVEGDFTYTDYVSTLSANWNIHTYQTTDEAYPQDYLMSGFYSFIFNDELNPVEGQEAWGGYVIVPEMAASLPVDVTEQVKAEHPEFGIPESATAGFAYTIDLNPDACFSDGTPITADDYVESMKRLLDPKLMNYRAADKYEGGFCIVNAEGYANQGQSLYVDNGVSGAYVVADFIVGEDGNYYTAEGYPVYVAVGYGIDWCSGNSLKAYVDAYGEAYFGLERWEELVALMDENGLVPANEETLAMLSATTTTNPNWGETDEDLPAYLCYYKTYPEMAYESVGCYKSGDMQITIVLEKSLAGFQLLYNLTGNWLVKTDLYDACIVESEGSYTSTYCTTLETCVSYGPYVMTSYQMDKGMHFSKNENWWGYTDGKHVYKDPVDGKIYTMYQTTEIDCQVVSDVNTAKLMFLAGELMTYPLQSDDYADYGNSEFAYFTPGQAVYFMILNGNMTTIQERENAADFDKAAQDLEILTLTSFHRALGLSYDKSLYKDTFSPAQDPAFGLIGPAYIYDPETGARYRDSEQAKQVLLDVYGIDASQFASVDDALASITGYDPVAAKGWFEQAYTEALELGYITDANGDGKCDQQIKMIYNVSGEVSEKTQKMLAWLTEQANLAAAGTPLEGCMLFEASAPLGNAWSDNVKAGLTDVVLAGWNGSAMDPYGLIEVYTYPNYQYDAQWWDSTSVQMTLNIDGADVTMNLKQWTEALNGTVVTIDGVDYNFGDGIGDPEVRLQILAGIEKEVLLTYNYLPFTVAGSKFLLSQKAYYVIEDYNPVMGRGGIAYLKYNYTDGEWTDYVASCGGNLTY